MLAKFMVIVVFVYAVLAILFTVGFAIYPSFMSSMSDFFGSESGRFLSVALSFIMGTVFLLAAPVVRFPLFFKILGGYALISGLGMLLISTEIWSNIIDFWLVENVMLYRTVGVFFGIVFWVFILYVTYPQKSESPENIVSEDET